MIAWLGGDLDCRRGFISSSMLNINSRECEEHFIIHALVRDKGITGGLPEVGERGLGVGSVILKSRGHGKWPRPA